MTKPLVVAVLIGFLFAAACRDRDALSAEQQEYEVVQEGAAGGVTGTLQAPGEVAPPLMPPLTGTNADTTTAFTLPSATDTALTQMPPGTIAGTLQTETAYPTDRRAPARSSPAPASTSPVTQPGQQSSAPTPPTPERRPTPPRESAPSTETRSAVPPPAEEPPPTATQREEPPPTTTQRDQPPPTTTRREEREPEREPDPPPPPPDASTTTDTRGDAASPDPSAGR